MKRIKYLIAAVFLLLYVRYLPGVVLPLKSSFGNGDLMLPRQIFVANNRIYVLDEYGNMTSGDEKIKTFLLNGTLVGEFGRGGEGPGEYREASAIYIFDQKIYILDSWGRKLHVFSIDGKKHLFTKQLPFVANQPYTTPDEFVVYSNETIYYNAGRSLKDNKLVTKLGVSAAKELSVEKDFLDNYFAYNDLKEVRRIYGTRPDHPDTVRNNYVNNGCLAVTNDKLYFTFWLVNIVYELSPVGKVLNQYTLPMESIDKTVNVVKMGQFNTIERKLNYDIAVDKGHAYVLSRDKNGDSVIFQLEEGKWVEKYRMKEELFAFDISDDTIYGIQRDEGIILVYKIK